MKASRVVESAVGREIGEGKISMAATVLAYWSVPYFLATVVRIESEWLMASSEDISAKVVWVLSVLLRSIHTFRPASSAQLIAFSR